LGMAHFVEHMMFMGTKQHPKPGGFDDFLAQNGAQISNAATGSGSTCYAFSTPHRAFKEGVSRFAEFFTDPLFDSKGAAKEMKAVNQEFQMHKDQDGYRQYMVSNQLANKKHPQSRFSIGNLGTLSKVDNAKLVDWYNKHYSANLMHVAVYTALPAEDIECLIAEKFAGVKNHKYKRKDTTGIPIRDPALVRKAIHTKPERDMRTISIEWQLPDTFAHKRSSRPDRQVAYVLGYEGPGSLVATLKQKQLALSVEAGMEVMGRDNAIFTIGLTLTEKGMGVRDQIIAFIFKSIHELKEVGVPKYIFKEQRQRDINAWETQPRTANTFDASMSAVREMFTEKLETYPRKQRVLSKWDDRGVKQLLEALTPDNFFMQQMGGAFPPKNIDGPVRTEKYYGAKFAVEAIPDETIATWKKAFDGSTLAGFREDESESTTKLGKLPPRNNYIPSGVKVGSIDPASPVFPALPQPVVLKDDGFGKLYVGVDRAFGDPYIHASVQIKTSGKIMDEMGPRARVLANILVDSIGESITSKKYPFTIAGMGAAVSLGKGTNLYVTLSGKNPQKATYDALLDIVLTPLKQQYNHYTSRGTFKMIKAATMRYYKNQMKSGARSTASRVLWNKFSNTRTPVEELMKLVSTVTYDEMMTFSNTLLKQIRLEGFIYGMITESNAKALYNKVENKLRQSSSTGISAVIPSISALKESEEFVSKFLVLPKDAGPWYLRASGSAGSNATVLLIDGGHLPCEEAIALPVLFKEVSTLFFKELRTKQQTGYVASAYATTVARRSVVEMVVESSWAGSGDLLKRFEAFNAMVLKGLNDGSILPKKKLDNILTSMLASFNAPIQTIGGMAGIMDGIIKEFDGDFDVEKKKQILLKKLTRDTILKVANKVLGVDNTRRFGVVYTPAKSKADAVPGNYKKYHTCAAKKKAGQKAFASGSSPLLGENSYASYGSASSKEEPTKCQAPDFRSKPKYKCVVATMPKTYSSGYSSGYGSGFAAGYGSGYASGYGSSYTSVAGAKADDATAKDADSDASNDRGLRPPRGKGKKGRGGDSTTKTARASKVVMAAVQKTLELHKKLAAAKTLRANPLPEAQESFAARARMAAERRSEAREVAAVGTKPQRLAKKEKRKKPSAATQALQRKQVEAAIEHYVANPAVVPPL